jgi:hypothetical protein
MYLDGVDSHCDIVFPPLIYTWDGEIEYAINVVFVLIIVLTVTSKGNGRNNFFVDISIGIGIEGRFIVVVLFGILGLEIVFFRVFFRVLRFEMGSSYPPLIVAGNRHDGKMNFRRERWIGKRGRTGACRRGVRDAHSSGRREWPGGSSGR